MDKDIDVLKILTDNFKERNHGAALSNYNILCNNISFLNNTLYKYIDFFKSFIPKLDENIHVNDCLNTDCTDNSKSAYYLKILIPRIIKNNMEILEKFYSRKIRN